MKKLLALLLVLCMVVGLVACGKPADNTDSTKPTNSANNNTEEEEPKETTPIREDISDIKEETLVLSTNDVDSNDAYINPEKFAGKKLQIYGYDSVVFDDIENMGLGSYIWMMRAAIDEWATLNQVEVTFEGDTIVNDMLSAINSGEKPDIVMGSNEYPILPNNGITRGFTDAEYEQLAKIAGPVWLDMMKYKGVSHAVQIPWGGNSLFYYNRTLFENYGAKTPKEYYLEGNWTWDTMEDCFEATTKDANGNGKIDTGDTYGSSSMYYLMEPYTLIEGDDGKLTGTIGTSEQYGRAREIVYKGRSETLSIGLGTTIQQCVIATTPRPSTHIGDAEWYNFAHLYQTLDNGDVIEVVPVPVYTNENPIRSQLYTTRPMSIMSTCDEPEAALALMSYILKVGMRYIADYSVGLFKCTYEGIRGASEYSKAWKENFEDVCEDRRASFAEIEDWDQECYEKMVSDIFAPTAKTWPVKRYSGTEDAKEDTSTMPNASALPILSQAQDAWIAKYNSLYAN